MRNIRNDSSDLRTGGRDLDEGVKTSRDLFVLVAADRERLLARQDTALVAVRLFWLLPTNPIATSSSVGA